MSDALFTVGTVPYLNGRPLVRWFWDTPEGRESGVRVVEAVPSQLARMLEDGEVDVAMVSSFELFRKAGLCFAAGMGVVAEGPVRSVRLLSRTPLDKTRTVSLDTSSLTSVALVKILLAESYGLTPQYRPAAPDLDAMLAESDAALLIGDLGYREYDPSLHVLDLGGGWQALTGLPFVYALWIGMPARLTPSLVALLQRAKEWGASHREEIARTEFRRLDESYERSRSYLVDVMRYDVGARETEALHQYGVRAYAHGLLDVIPSLEAFHPIPPAAGGER